jgi:hypothetical protein
MSFKLMANERNSTEENPDSIEIPPELQAEFEVWERTSDEAWEMIDRMEKDEGFESW